MNRRIRELSATHPARLAAVVVAVLLGVEAFGCADSATQDTPKGDSGSPGVAAEIDQIAVGALRELLASARGHVLVVNVWATWCVPCRSEYPELVRLHRDYAARGLHVLGISVDNPGEKDREVKKFLVELRPAFRNVLVDWTENPEAFMEFFDSEWGGELPATFVFNAAGKRVLTLLNKQELASFVAAVEPLMAPAEP
ncbi:MAG: TlpA family protein disulfide reductase [Candidatus Schekmanbacteria bacterium]|nr:TlpA family protein disulfide reductase [Candidatus Schekmanbacteria bacterium]